MAKRRKPKRDEQPTKTERVERKPAPPSPNPYAWRNRVAEWFNR